MTPIILSKQGTNTPLIVPSLLNSISPSSSSSTCSPSNKDVSWSWGALTLTSLPPRLAIWPASRSSLNSPATLARATTRDLPCFCQRPLYSKPSPYHHNIFLTGIGDSVLPLLQHPKARSSRSPGRAARVPCVIAVRAHMTVITADPCHMAAPRVLLALAAKRSHLALRQEAGYY